MATQGLKHEAKCPRCGATVKVSKVYKDRSLRFHHFYCSCGAHFAETWRLAWPNRWMRTWGQS